MLPRHYAFRSTWRVRASVGDCWSFLTAPDQRWLDWWPSLREIAVDRTPDVVGSRAECVWRSPFGHRLTMGMTLTECLPVEQVVLAIDGDVRGCGVVDFAGDETASVLDITLNLEAASRWINVTTPVLRPFFTLGHHMVMRRGERGLNDELGDQVVEGDPMA